MQFQAAHALRMISIILVLYGLSGPFAAALMQRIGIRRVMGGALVLIALACGLATIMRTPWQLDLHWGVLVGLAMGSLASVLAALVANRWFVKNRSLVMGQLTPKPRPAVSGRGEADQVPGYPTGIGVGCKEIALRIDYQRGRPGITLDLILLEYGPDGEQSTLRRKHLDALILVIADIHIPRRSSTSAPG